MWLSMIGAVCVLGGCSAMGIMAYLRLERRVRLLTAFAALSDRLVSEIGFRLTPLPELAQRLETPELAPFWGYVRKNYALYGKETYAEVWEGAVGQLDLSDLDRGLLADMGGVLGAYDAENQTRSLCIIRDQLKVSVDLAREERQKQGKISGMLGLLGGGLLVVILI